MILPTGGAAPAAAYPPGRWHVGSCRNPGSMGGQSRLTGLTAAVVLLAAAGAARASAPVAPPSTPALVVATFDTGTNPFHPCFRRPGLDHPAQRTPTYPQSSRPLRLTFGESYDDSLAASERALESIEPETLYHL